MTWDWFLWKLSLVQACRVGADQKFVDPGRPLMSETITSPFSNGGISEKSFVHRTSSSKSKISWDPRGCVPKSRSHSEGWFAKYCQGVKCSPSSDRSKTQRPARGEFANLITIYATWKTLKLTLELDFCLIYFMYMYIILYDFGFLKCRNKSLHIWF